jgi:hypothetical protein
MQFQVPQYIEVEDRIVGPLTLAQFLYLAFAFFLTFIGYFYLAPMLWIVCAVLAWAAAVALAFFKYNGRPLVALVRAGYRYLVAPRRYAREILSEPEQARTAGVLNRLRLLLETSTAPLLRREPPDNAIEVVRRATGNREIAKRVDYR